MKTRFLKKKSVLGITILLIAALLCGGYYQYNVYYPSTKDAYVSAYIVDIAPQVSGKVNYVYVKNNQYVHKGKLLFSINPAKYQITLNQDKALLKSTESNLTSVKSELNSAIATNNLNKFNYNVDKKLVGPSAISETAYKQAYYNYKKSEAMIKEELALVQKAENNVVKVEQQIKHDELNLSYTKVYAPVNGYISNFNLDKGQYLNIGDKVFAMVDSNHWWVNSNYKETDIARIKPGQTASVKLDMYNHTFKGKVQSISYGSGDSFSLLPSENASGNWVKVTQRFPVKILIQNTKQLPLRVGASADVTVNTLS